MRLEFNILFNLNVFLVLTIKSHLASLVLQKRWAFLNVTSITPHSDTNNYMKNILFTDSALYSLNSPTYYINAQLIDVQSIGPLSTGSDPYLDSVDNFTNPLGCSKYVNRNLPENFIALVSRGECTFEKKVQVAIENKAIAILVYNNDLDVITMYIRNNSIPSIMISDYVGNILIKLLRYSNVYVTIKPGPIEVIENNSLPSKSSIYFVAFAFLTVIIVTFIWLTVYYVQKFRYLNTKKRLNSKLKKATLKALAKMNIRKLSNEDKELTETCPICLENYQVNDQIRELPCGHYFHQKEVDVWLIEHRNCPMCKINILQACGIEFNRVDNFLQRYVNILRGRDENVEDSNTVNIDFNAQTDGPSSAQIIIQDQSILTSINDTNETIRETGIIKTISEQEAKTNTPKLIKFNQLYQTTNTSETKNIFLTQINPDILSQRDSKSDAEFNDVPL